MPSPWCKECACSTLMKFIIIHNDNKEKNNHKKDTMAQNEPYKGFIRWNRKVELPLNKNNIPPYGSSSIQDNEIPSSNPHLTCLSSHPGPSSNLRSSDSQPDPSLLSAYHRNQIPCTSLRERTPKGRT